jgi:DNA invertase Pin-like site-specific DNA recombinase
VSAAKRKPGPTGPIRAAIYIRVSTEDQAEDGTTSLEDQERKCREYIEYKGYQLVGVWREDGSEGPSSGKSFDRPKWRDLEAACKRGEVSNIVFAKHDRLARKAWMAGQKAEELRALAVDITILNMQVDTSTPNGRFMFNMLMAGAEWERDTILERLSVGQYSKARNGGWPSSKSAAPYGLTVEGIKRDARLVISPGEAATARKAAVLLVDEGKSVSDACRTLNALGMLPRKGQPWYPALLRDVLSKEALFGLVKWGKTGDGSYGQVVIIPDVPAVLTRERWQAVQRAMVMRPSEPSQGKRVYPLTGRMVAPCGQAYQGMRRGDTGQVQYRDSGKIWRGSPDWKPCSCARLDAPTIEERVFAEVKALLSSPARLEALAASYLGSAGSADEQQAELAKLDRDIERLRDRITTQLAALIRAGIDPDQVASAIAQLNDEASALEKRRDDIARYLDETADRQEQMTSLGGLSARVAGRLDSMSLDEQKELLDLLNVRIEVLDTSKTPAIRITGTVTAIGCDLATEERLSRCSPYWSQVED